MDLETMQTSATRASDMLKLLGHPHRLMVLCELKMGEKSVSELASKVGVSQSPLSQHLARMRYEDVVETRRDGQTVYYSLKEGEASLLIESLYEIFCAPNA
ncbi:MAG: winged helix-turn-helix transcriptional regulator [Gammaproteobacteria bacterium]|jgi:DNA-binding transcriptional ArsR family regulator|nr:winged helix-turn-helix transcriptional regulator [Gammaproteobacteria bacterium]MDG1233908.1 metalloregulator ArsR/SmtB family transcription factor [Pseudomonadales bacterium]MBT5685506.1 winged helix-turn-helix transcriptional regulator [Gammaproteobacteria bacterium]MBT5724306.1 winged helix-turn-helix transcriptional regulator [Gammaproteobacteria bacterium]MBT6572168.1 winged helix-turn-helix transcriptional regulator [Gammaproteobacteria bacterium]